MKKIIYCILILIIGSCSEDDHFEEQSNNIRIVYQGYYEVLKELRDTSIKLTDIMIYKVVEQVSDTEEIDLLQIIATSKTDDSYITFKVLPNAVGYDALYKEAFEFRTPESHPYSTEDIDQTTEDINFEVLVNDNTEFSATFSGTLNHYSYGLHRCIYLEIKSGSMNYKY